MLEKFKDGLFLAPLAGYSDAGMRSLCYKYGAVLCFTEMVSAKGLYYKSQNTEDLLFLAENEKGKTAVQLFGSEPKIFAEVVNYECLKDFPIIDINMGCPVNKIVKNGEGSALMKNPRLVYEIVKSARDAVNDKEISVKFRLGFDKDNQNAVEVAVSCEEAGASFITIHGRTRDAYYSGEADYALIKKVKENVRIPVCANGGVIDRESYLKMKEYTGADFVMIARGAIGKPYIFSEILGKEYIYDVKSAIREHIDSLSYLPEKVMLNNMKKHIALYIKGYPAHKKIKEQIFGCGNLADMLSIIDNSILQC